MVNSVPLREIENGCFLENKRPRLDERWIIEIEGNQFVKYAGLLDYTHQIGISSVDVEPLLLPTKDDGNFAICRASVVSKVGEFFTDIGDANPTNFNAKVGKYLLRLASTRAIARALRSFTNAGLTALEELEKINARPKPLIETCLFEAGQKLHCQDSGRLCKGLRLVR